MNALRYKGITQLLKIHPKITERRATQQKPSEAAEVPQIPVQSQREDELLSQFVGRAGGGDIPNNNNLAEAAADINQKLIHFIYAEQRIIFNDSNFSIIKFWHLKRRDKNWKELYYISQGVYGAAFSQVKVKSDFSGFALVYNHLRTSLSHKMLDEIFVVKNNLDFLAKVNFV